MDANSSIGGQFQAIMAGDTRRYTCFKTASDQENVRGQFDAQGRMTLFNVTGVPINLGQLIRRLFVLWSALFATAVLSAGDPITGQAKYLANCATCHSAPPDFRAIRAANNPDELALAIDAVSGMGFLNALLNRQDIENIAAYIGTPSISQNVLTIGRSGAGAGVVTAAPGVIACGGICASSYVPDELVNLQARPQVGSAFAGWTGDCRGKRLGSCLVTMNRAQTVFARFARNGPLVNYSGLWWAGQAENGWGLSITQRVGSGQQYNILYVFDQFGEPVWYVMPGGVWSDNFTTFRGSLFRPQGSSLTDYDPAKLLFNPVGEVTLRFPSAGQMEMRFQLEGIAGTRTLVRPAIANLADLQGSTLFGVNYPYARTAQPAPADTPNLGDLWWGGLAENGWGMSIAQDGAALFGVWHTFDREGRPTWFALPGGNWIGAQFRATLYRSSGAPWLGATYTPSRLVSNAVGIITLEAGANGNLQLRYTFEQGGFAGTSQTKSLSRLPF